MSGNNSGQGMGCSLWLIDFIYNKVTNRRIKKFNKQARALEEYDIISNDVLFPAISYRENIIISGGDTPERMSLCERLIQNCSNQKQAVIVLHMGNKELEQVVAKYNGVIANNQNRTFDAFTSFDLQEICQVVLETNRTKYEIKPSGRYILEVVYKLLSSAKKLPYFSNYAECPFYKLSDRINDRLTKGLITQAEADDLDSLLMMGQSESANVEAFFNDMKSFLSHIASENTNKPYGTSVLSAIKNKKILCIDINSSANIMLIELIVNSLNIAMSRGYVFTFFLDDIPITANELLKNALCQKSNHSNIICTNDLYALLNARDEVFSILVGEAEKTVLFSHGSHISCEMWAKYIGEYEKIEVSYNSNSGFNDSGNWSFNTNHGQQMKEKREYKVKPEELNRLYQNEAFIYDNKNGSLIQARIEL